MRFERVFHFRSTRLEDLQKIFVTAFEVLEHLGQLFAGRFSLKTENPADDMVCPCLVDEIEVARFSGRFERSDDDPRGIGPQVQGMAVQESEMGQGGSRAGLVWVGTRARCLAPN